MAREWGPAYSTSSPRLLARTKFITSARLIFVVWVRGKSGSRQTVNDRMCWCEARSELASFMTRAALAPPLSKRTACTSGPHDDGIRRTTQSSTPGTPRGGIFDIFWIHVQTIGQHDQIALATPQIESTLFVHLAQITRVIPAAGQCGCGGVRVSPVALHYIRSLDENLALAVEHNAHPRNGPAHGTRFAIGNRSRRDDRRCF